MSNHHDQQDRDRWARLRFAIIGPLLAAPPEPRQLHAALRDLSAKTWRHPVHRTAGALRPLDDRALVLRRARASTIRWPRSRPGVRSDCGQPPAVAGGADRGLAAQYHAHPGWSFQLHYDNLRVALAGDAPLPSYATLRRLPARAGAGSNKAARPARASAGALAAASVCSSARCAASKSSTSTPCGTWTSTTARARCSPATAAWSRRWLLGVLDDRSRLVCHVQWYLDETAESLVHGFSQALQRGACRAR